MSTQYPPRVEESATLRMSELADRLAADGADVINLGSGAPDFDTPEHVVEEAKRALDAGHHQSVSTAGIPELRQAIADKLAIANGIDTDPEAISVTPGSKFALFAAVSALVREGDEVVLLDPSWVSYEAMVNFIGGRVNRVRLDPDAGFALGDVSLADHVSDDTQVLVLNNPSNPAGAVFSESELQAIRDLAVDHDFWVVTDEIYEKLTYGVEHTSIASLDGMADRTVTTNGFSKGYAMSGWRLGYVTGPRSVIEEIQSIQSQTVSGATSFAQYGAVAALEGPQDAVEEMRQTYDARIQAAMEVVRDAGVDVPRPRGGLHMFVPVETDDADLAERLLEEHHVATTPGSAFGVPGYLRVSCSVPEKRLVEGIRRLAPYLRSEG